jgi:hypothetical protein
MAEEFVPCKLRRERGIVAGFLPLCERQTEIEGERKSGTRLFQKVGAHRPRLVGRGREREEACWCSRLPKGLQVEDFNREVVPMQGPGSVSKYIPFNRER